jgi:two-component system cell cycle sensor histidine kinase/response regulator CckA
MTDFRTRAGAESDKRHTILVLEDDVTLSYLVGRILEMTGDRVLVANDGDEALSLAARHPGSISLLVTDMVMQGMNGLEVASRLRNTHPSTKILFMTGDAFSEDAALCGHLIQKPFDLQSLVACVRGMIDQPDAA